MSLRDYYKVQTDDVVLNKVQDNVERAVIPLIQSPIIDGVQWSGALTMGNNTVNHKLGRQPVAWTVADIDAAETVHRTAWNSRTLTLQASGPVNIKLWIY